MYRYVINNGLTVEQTQPQLNHDCIREYTNDKSINSMRQYVMFISERETICYDYDLTLSETMTLNYTTSKKLITL